MYCNKIPVRTLKNLAKNFLFTSVTGTLLYTLLHKRLVLIFTNIIKNSDIYKFNGSILVNYKKNKCLMFIIFIFCHRSQHPIPLPLKYHILAHLYHISYFFSSKIFSISNLYDKTTFFESASSLYLYNILN
jgi:hypothetical protein